MSSILRNETAATPNLGDGFVDVRNHFNLTSVPDDVFGREFATGRAFPTNDVRAWLFQLVVRYCVAARFQNRDIKHEQIQ